MIQNQIPNENLIPHLHSIISKKICLYEHSNFLNSLDIDLENIKLYLENE